MVSRRRLGVNAICVPPSDYSAPAQGSTHAESKLCETAAESGAAVRCHDRCPMLRCGGAARIRAGALPIRLEQMPCHPVSSAAALQAGIWE